MLKRGRRLDETKPARGSGCPSSATWPRSIAGSLRLDASPLGGLRAVLELPGDQSEP